MTTPNEQSEAQSLNESKAYLESVNRFAKKIIDARNGVASPQLQLDEVKDYVSTYQETFEQDSTYLKELQEQLAEAKQSMTLRLPDLVDANQFLEKPNLDKVKDDLKQAVDTQSTLLGELQNDEINLVVEFQTALQSQLVLMKKCVTVKDELQSTQLMINFHQWHHDAQSLLKNPNIDLNELLDLHIRYGEFFQDGKGDPNSATKSQFQQLEMLIALEMNNLLHDTKIKPEQKLDLIVKALDNINPQERGTSALRANILPLMKQLQKQIPLDAFKQLPEDIRSKIGGTLDTNAFQQPQSDKRQNLSFRKEGQPEAPSATPTASADVSPSPTIPPVKKQRLN